MREEEPVESGWYAYSGGAQSIIFHLRDMGQWSAHFADGTAHDCAWGYVEQALTRAGAAPLGTILTLTNVREASHARTCA